MDAPSPITSSLLDEHGLVHAFFTRQGGVSLGPFASLNLSENVGDAPEDVQENLRRASGWFGLAPSQLCWVSQVHGSRVVAVGPGSDVTGVRGQQADAVVAVGGRLACCVRTADCIPILMADILTGAVAAIHAGWRGLAAGVIPQTVRHIQQLAGGRAKLVAAIGPHIRSRAFEIGLEVASILAPLCPDKGVIETGKNGRVCANLVRIATYQLESAEVAPSHIDDVGGCTASDSARFYSHRRDGAASGRHLHCICPPGIGRSFGQIVRPLLVH